MVDCSHVLEEKKTKSKPKKLGIAGKLASPSKKSVKKKQSSKKTSSKASTARKQKIRVRREHKLKSSFHRESAAESRQSGDLAGLSRAEQAASESVGELVEEGNIFDAGAVAGVEEADDQDRGEVPTHELARTMFLVNTWTRSS